MIFNGHFLKYYHIGIKQTKQMFPQYTSHNLEIKLSKKNINLTILAFPLIILRRKKRKTKEINSQICKKKRTGR